MKKILLALTMLFSLGSFAAEKLPTEVKFEEGNFFAVTQQFNQTLLDNFNFADAKPLLVKVSETLSA